MEMSATHESTPSGGWHRAFQDLSREHGFEPLRVEGSIPSELEGTLFRNGPSLFSSYGTRYGHWFDGDGAVSAVKLGGGKAEGAIRLVQTEGLLAERKAGRRIFSIYGTAAAGWPLRRLGGGRVKNAANTSVMIWDQRLFALYEGGKPTELSIEDLSTIGESTLGGTVTTPFSAHPHRIAARKASYNFGLAYGKDTVLHLYELRDDGGTRRMATHKLPAPTTLHDFIATDRFLIFLITPVRLRLLPFLLGRGSVSQNLHWRPEEGVEVLVVPIDDPEKATRFRADPSYQWHFANAFERDGELVLDRVRYPDFGSNLWLGEAPLGGQGTEAMGTFHRTTIDPKARTLRSEEVWQESCEFPTVAPGVIGKPYRFAYVAAHAPGKRREMYQRIAKIDVESGSASQAELPHGHYPSEPIFVPRPGGSAEDHGWLLSLVYDAGSHTSHLAILDAAAIEKGPIARAHFDHHVPLTFHGRWMRG